MMIFKKLKKYFSNHILPNQEIDPETAYNLWAQNYDNQKGNLMLELDEEIFSYMINSIPLKNKIIVDVGCGTGRHWKKMFEKHPAEIIGYDVSDEMLKVLRQKFPMAVTYSLKNDQLQNLKNHSCHLLVSTLTIAHIQYLEEAFYEWNRVLKPGGDIVITDYHPEALARGGKRTFPYNKRLFTVKNHLHSIGEIKKIAMQYNLSEVAFKERIIDDAVKHYYKDQKALAVFEQFKGVPIIYGIHLKKPDAAV